MTILLVRCMSLELCWVSDGGHADLSTRIGAGVRKPPRNEPAGKEAPGREPCTMGIWLALSVPRGAAETSNGAESGRRNDD